jgi:hypothetical protein
MVTRVMAAVWLLLWAAAGASAAGGNPRVFETDKAHRDRWIATRAGDGPNFRKYVDAVLRRHGEPRRAAGQHHAPRCRIQVIQFQIDPDAAAAVSSDRSSARASPG